MRLDYLEEGIVIEIVNPCQTSHSDLKLGVKSVKLLISIRCSEITKEALNYK
jgi:hypothetical protein